MTQPGSVIIRWALLAMLLMLAPHLWAANCTAVFSDPDGTNSNLQASGNTLDLSGVPFANTPWPSSGTTLSSGDYYYSADNLGNNYRLNVANGATVRIFVNGSLAVGNNVELNRNGDAGRLLLVVDGNFSTGNNPIINGLVYASGSISIGNNANITGGLAAGGAIAVGNTAPNTDYSGVGQGLLAGLCTPPVELSANGQTVGPVVVGAGEDVLLSVTGSGCPAAGPFLYQQWTDRWTVNNDQSQSASFSSVCDRSPVTRSVTFDAPGNYTVQFEAVYRSCFLFWCGEPQFFGIDQMVISVVSEAIDHFEIIHDGVALTCQPETVTIRACADAACDNPAGLYTDPVTATLAPDSGWVSSNPVTFTGGVGQATLQNTTGGEVTLDVVGSQPATRPQAVTLCDNGSGAPSSANCNLEFFESGLAFDVPDLLSHRPSGPVEIRAVRQDPQTQACVPAFENVQKTLRLWSGYVDPGPNGRPVSRPLTVNGTEVSGDSAAPTDLMLDFGPGGIAEVDVTYPDAGQVRLDARYVGSPATNDDGLVMPGADSFISVPAGLCVSAAGECPAGDDSCPVFVRADEAFELSLTAMGWESAGDTDLCQGNPVTPNFRLLDIPLTSAVMAPAGGRDGSFNPLSYTHVRSADATTTVDARVSEVGVFEFTAAPNAGTYLGLSVDGGTSPPVGRFYPDRFRVSVDPGEVGAACTAASPFTYTGQDFDWFTTPSLQIEPLSVLDAPTENYTEPGFQRLTPAGVVRSFPSQDRVATDAVGAPMALERTFADGALSVLAPGLMQYQYNPGDTFRYTKTPDTRVAPFSPELEFQVTSVADSDGVNAGAAPYEFMPVADFPIRYGRLAMENVYGPETIAALEMPFRLEYWDGGQYILNTDDSCTPWTTATIAGTADHHTLVPDAGTFTAGGARSLMLQPDGSRGTDTLAWAVEEWLQDDVDEDGALDAPSALATFGVYRGHDRVIYWREP
jgi:MSHA biogenesis protein MshQ